MFDRFTLRGYITELLQMISRYTQHKNSIATPRGRQRPKKSQNNA